MCCRISEAGHRLARSTSPTSCSIHINTYRDLFSRSASVLSYSLWGAALGSKPANQSRISKSLFAPAVPIARLRRSFTMNFGVSGHRFRSPSATLLRTPTCGSECDDLGCASCLTTLPKLRKSWPAAPLEYFRNEIGAILYCHQIDLATSATAEVNVWVRLIARTLLIRKQISRPLS